MRRWGALLFVAALVGVFPAGRATPVVAYVVNVTAPAALSQTLQPLVAYGLATAYLASFTPPFPATRGRPLRLRLAAPLETEIDGCCGADVLPEGPPACAVANASTAAGALLLTYRGDCRFLVKFLNAAPLGVAGMLVINSGDEALFMGSTDPLPSDVALVPGAAISRTLGDLLIDAVRSDPTGVWVDLIVAPDPPPVFMFVSFACAGVVFTLCLCGCLCTCWIWRSSRGAALGPRRRRPPRPVMDYDLTVVPGRIAGPGPPPGVLVGIPLAQGDQSLVPAPAVAKLPETEGEGEGPPLGPPLPHSEADGVAVFYGPLVDTPSAPATPVGAHDPLRYPV